jgi:1-deoxy-D-xylulose-5-phosphate reductoisomerase
LSQRIAILGSTGSIGCSALEVVQHLGAPYRAVALSGHRQAEKLLEQARQHRPSAVALTGDDVPGRLVDQLRQCGAEVFTGPDALLDLVRGDDVDTVLAAVVGAAGVPAVLAAVEAGKRIALANKEALVVAGSLVIAAARRRKLTLLPVDSEHSAVFQAALAGRRREIRRVILTASGGPFLNWTLEQMRSATVAEALNHPTWQMGAKITIDSATMFNKGLEIIEACWLFDLPPEQVEVVVHPESIVHSMVEFVDGSMLAQLSPPDMRTPIQYALTYPERREGIGRRMNLGAPFSLNFQPPDLERFPALRVAYEVARLGGSAGAVMNAANEAAVEAFASAKITLPEIPRLVEGTIRAHRLQPSPGLDDLLRADAWARSTVQSLIARRGMADPEARQPAGQDI